MVKLKQKIGKFINVFFLVLFLIPFGNPTGASAKSPFASVAATVALTAPTFSDAIDVDLQWSVSGLPVSSTHYVLIWSRKKAASATTYLVANCKLVSTIPPNVSGSSGVVTFSYSPVVVVSQDEVEFVLTVENTAITGPGCAGAPASLPAATVPLSTTFIDTTAPSLFFTANPPSKGTSAWNANPVACNTFEMWGIASDNLSGVAIGYSGLQTWNQAVTGIFIPPAEGTAPALLSWQYTFPSTASGQWTFKVNPTDAVGNDQTAVISFRNILDTPSTAERANCPSFPDIAGNPNETYFRYLAKLGIFSGDGNGYSNINSTLSRAEAATLFEKANGYTATGLPIAPPPNKPGCIFTDVSSSDWFSGWVWQACDDGFMNGAGGGLFDPYGTFSRGQAVTVLNNINTTPKSSYLAAYSNTYRTVLNKNALWRSTTLYRSLPWTDLPDTIEAYYSIPAKRAYNAGVIEATGPTTFSPGSPILRGEFAKMLYRALSRIP